MPASKMSSKKNSSLQRFENILSALMYILAVRKDISKCKFKNISKVHSLQSKSSHYRYNLNNWVESSFKVVPNQSHKAKKIVSRETLFKLKLERIIKVSSNISSKSKITKPTKKQAILIIKNQRKEKSVELPSHGFQIIQLSTKI